MSWKQAAHQTKRDAAGRGRYVKGPRCHACAKPAGYFYITHPATDGGDGPGFILCDRAACFNAYRNMPPAEAIAFFTAQLARHGFDAQGNKLKPGGTA